MASRSARKRGIAEVEQEDTSLVSNTNDLLHRVRNTWQFACLMQFIQLFGSALKIDNELDVDVCLARVAR